MKKKTLLVLCGCIFLIFMIPILVKGVALFLFSSASKWKSAAEYEKYEEQFGVVKDYIFELCGGSCQRHFYIEYWQEQDRILYDLDLEKYFEVPENIYDALMVLTENAFPDSEARLSQIYVQENRIVFDSKAGYALVWSPDEKPTWLYSPDEERDISVKKAGDGWYHVVIDP